MTNNERINNTSKRDQRIARDAAAYAYTNRRWTYRTLWEAYDRPSVNKERAWSYCENLCREMKGHDLLISSRNTMVFSVVFQFEDENGKPAVAYITRDYDRFAYAE